MSDELEALRAENVALKEQLCLIRGAIEELALGVEPREPHWAHHFAVAGPDGSKHVVPWDWIMPPFSLVKAKMDSMGDYGTRTNREAQDAQIMRPFAEAFHWIEQQREVRWQRSWIGCGNTLTWAKWSPRGHDTKAFTVRGNSMLEAVYDAREDKRQ